MTQPPYPGPASEPSRPPLTPGQQIVPQGPPPPSAPLPHGQTPYSQTPYSQTPYGQLPYGQLPHGQLPHGQPTTAQPQGYAHRPGHPGGFPAPGPHLAPQAYKDTTAAYLFWFFLGGLGMHKFYLRSPGLGALYIVLSVLGWSTAWLGIGFLLLIPLAVLLVIDACTMPERIRVVNAQTHALNVRFG